MHWVRGTFRLQLLAWVTYGVVHFLASSPAVQEGELAMLALMRLVKAATGLLVSSAGGVVLHRLAGPEYRAPWRAGAAVVLATGTAWMILDRIVLVTVAPVFGSAVPWSSVPRGVDLEYYFVMAAWSAAVIGFSVVQQSRRLREELLRREIDARDARLHALVAQLNPHFLFNALNMIRTRIPENPAAARDMLTHLSDLLRRMLDVDTSATVPLDEELEFVDDYLAIQSGRFEGTLDASVSATSEARAVAVPPLILQPLVENAMKFGARDANGVLRIMVTAAVTDGMLQLTVENSGTLRETHREDAMGLQLTRRRLEALGAGHSFSLRQAGEMVRAEVRIPRAGA